MLASRRCTSALTGEFADQMPDLKNAEVSINTISVLAIAVAGWGCSTPC
jgi:hypothetical protein